MGEVLNAFSRTDPLNFLNLLLWTGGLEYQNMMLMKQSHFLWTRYLIVLNVEKFIKTIPHILLSHIDFKMLFHVSVILILL